jgi:uncharacterized protein (DUF1778 family)
MKPAQNKSVKADRMQIRVDSRSKKIIQKAADYSNEPLSHFVVSHTLDAAEKVIEEHEKINLSKADWNIFFDALDNPPKPNRKLKSAFKRYRQANR